MVNRGRVGAIFVRGRAPVILVVLLVGGALLLKRDAAGPSTTRKASIALSDPQNVRAAFGRLPLSFEPNHGQSDARVKFLAHGSGYSLYLTSGEAVLALPPKGGNRPVVEMQFGEANQAADVAGIALLPGHSNYFIGNDRSRWRRNIPQFSRVQYRNLYPGIDLDFYGKEGRLEYDFEVAPGADPSQIDLNLKGASNLKVAGNGDLILAVDGGELRFQAPHVYQTTLAGIQAVAGSFILGSNNRVGFQIGDYDRSRTLVIDPVLTFSTYLGGSGDESCTVISASPVGFVPHCPSIAVDSASRVYVAGATDSPGSSFPLPPGGTTPILDGGADVFLVRFNSTGTALDYTTYVGGSGTEYPTGVGVDSGFNVYVAGTTNSQNFPTTAGAFQSGPSSAGTNHVFFSKFDSSGSVDLYSTYLFGTTGADTASALAVDTLGRAYLFGITSSSDFPLTAGALQNSFAPTNQFFFSKIDPSSTGTGSLLYSTFIGSTTSTGGNVTGGGIAVDSTFNVYLAGGTNITSMPIVNAYQGTEQGGYDVWAAKLGAPANNTEQYTPVYESYLGGTGDDVAYGVATDGTNTFITGSTTSTNITIPSTIAAFQSSNKGGSEPAIPTCLTNCDAFVAKLGLPVTSGTTQGSVPLVYFSYLGGTSGDVGLSIATDAPGTTNAASGNARVTGFTDSTDFPVTTPAPGSNIQTSSGGGRDAFIARILTNTVSTTTNTSTANYLGGSGTDIGTSVAVDPTLNDYVAGETSSGNFPVQPATPFQANLSGPTDAFVTKLGPSTGGLSFTCVTTAGTGCPSPVPANPVTNPSPVGVGNNVTFTYSIYNTGDPVSGVLFTDTLSNNSTLVSISASPGTCPSAALNGMVVCNLGIVPSSITTTSTTTATTAAAATVTVTVASTVPTSTGCAGVSASAINNSGALAAGPLFSTANAQNFANVNDFCLTATPAAATVTAGAPATYVIKVTPTGSIPESVSLSCTAPLPSGAACVFTNNPIPNLANGAQSRTLEITTQPRVTTPGSLYRKGPVYAFWLPMSGAALLGAGLSRKRRVLLGVFFVAILGAVALQAGCSSSGSNTSTTTGTPAGTYTITVNATSVAVRSTTVQLTVN